MPKQKNLIILLMFLLAVGIASATIEIKIIQYDPPSQAARIQIGNIGETDYTDVSMKIDDRPEEKVVILLRPKTAIIKSKILKPGTHTITVTTKEGQVFTNELYFTKSADVVENEIKKETEERLEREEEQRKQAEEREKQRKEQLTAQKLEKKEKSNIGLILTTTLLLLILIVLLYLTKKTKKGGRTTKKQKKMHVPKKFRHVSGYIKKIMPPLIRPPSIKPEIKPEIKQETPFHVLNKLRSERKSAFEKLDDLKKGQKELKKDVFDKLGEIKKEERDLFKEIKALKKPITHAKPKTNALAKLKNLRKRQKEACDKLEDLEKQQKNLMANLSGAVKGHDIFARLARIK